MAYKHTFDLIAAAEYEEAIIWYDKESTLAADRFIIEVEETIKMICVNPYRYRNTFENFREVSLKRFPYSIVFLPDISQKEIAIISVFHHKRNPQRKFRKK